MSKRSFLILFLLTGICFIASSQARLPAYGLYSEKELNTLFCPYDPGASAVILLDEGYNAYSEPGALVLYHRRRIRILKQSGLHYANIEIPFYTGGNGELVRSVRAMSYTPEGNGFVTTVMDSASIYTNKLDDYYAKIVFAIPAVKTGSIIEYSYEVVRPNYMPIPDWFFQTDIPVLKSALQFDYPILYPFEYLFRTDREHNVKVKRSPGQSPGIYFEMENIPALEYEPLMGAASDNLMGIRFQLLGLQTLTGNQNDAMLNWKKLAVELDDHPDLGLLFRKDIDMDPELERQISGVTDADGKIGAIYTYFKSHYSWNGLYTRFARDGFRKIQKEHKGASGELNLLLVKMLKQSGIEAYPLLAADKHFGIADSIYPSLEAFTKSVAIAYSGSRYYVLDATDEHNIPALIPASLLNTFVLQIDNKKPRFFRLTTSDAVYSRLISISSSLGADGTLSGEMETSCGGYAGQLDEKAWKEDPALFSKWVISRSPEGLVPESVNCEKDSLAAALYESVKFHMPLNAEGGYILLRYDFFRDLSKNIFTAPVRATAIDFLYPLNINTEFVIQLPEGAETGEILPDQVVRTAEKDMMIARTIRRSGNELKINISFSQSGALFPAYRYDSIRKFYAGMQKLLDQPITIKLK